MVIGKRRDRSDDDAVARTNKQRPYPITDPHVDVDVAHVVLDGLCTLVFHRLAF